VCYDAKKTEKEYTSHSVKSYDRLTGEMNTTCPTLLSQECRYCHEVGHTAKYCKELAERKKYDEKYLLPLQKEHSSYFTDNKTDQNVAKRVSFAVLAYDSDEEVQVKPTPVVAAPKPVTTAAKPALTGWANIVAKPAQVLKPVETTSVLTEIRQPTRQKTPTIAEGLKPVEHWVKPALTRSETLGRPAPSRPIMKNWADISSSDEEDEVETIKTQFQNYTSKFQVCEKAYEQRDEMDRLSGDYCGYDPSW
jgi:hypothetical protein